MATSPSPSKPRVRFAPSPTGYLHIGGARTALFNYLYARQQGGTFLLRMEDTDLERSTPESVKAILDGLKWLGIDWDEGPERGGDHGPYFQTQRLDLYKKYADQLIAEGKAYRCYCTREELEERRAVAEREKRTYKYEGTCRERKDVPEGRTSVVRFKMPLDGGSVSFTDQVIGTITKEHSDLDDWVMLRADGIPLYNYGCVIDDHLMEITLVGRGQEHINSTFPQLMLYGALGWQPPQFAHFPLILGPDREKLSKRRHPEADVMLHAKTGVLPEALLNFVVRLGWGHGNDEVIPLPQMIEWFGFDHVGTTSGVWNPEKLLWLNQQYFKLLSPERVGERLLPFLQARGLAVPSPARLQRIVLSFRERVHTLEEMAAMAAPYLVPGVTLDEKAAAKHLGPDSRALLAQVREQLTTADWSVPALDAVIKAVSERAGVGMGKVAQPVRVAVTGNTTSPGIGETLELLGRDEALARIDAALARG
ncbi:glutamate--tRNA ligase [Aggregicoccus sp. 17bor-14]|uniref:glutamate--tRNA ligase n=1 Tax=Myxococcaceae TaxID=31 RepID=UPI00129C59D6|nr:MULTISPECIES: glutamate--tRNA ligase [Myxococcaceae]MBF5041417.1 glutamate--tRNA ligase [Simulacricoccus sp. 17bor-14]MRI87201.1 glutamate--tRNA ligase [Aggregicoccus sp. 17bor-14]